MKQSSGIYYPQLDSIRGFFFMLVFIYHAWHPVLGTGFFPSLFHAFYEKIYLSMDVFFVLSSFLLTKLGINEYKRTGQFSFSRYFLRRVLRIWPLYYAIMIFSFLLVPFFASRSGVSVTLPPPAWYIFFISNFYSDGHVFFLRILWSLSVEEQFYLLLGISLLVFQKNLRIVFGIILLIGIVFNIGGIISGMNIYFHTLTYFYDFAAGAFLAWFISYRPRIEKFFRDIPKKKSRLIYLFFFVTVAVALIIQNKLTGLSADITELIIRFGFVAGITFLIGEQLLNKNTALPIGKSRFLAYTGKISYGLYCFHGIVLTFGNFFLEKYHIGTGIFTILLFFIINYVIASASYAFLEKPFLRLKERFSKRAAMS